MVKRITGTYATTTVAGETVRAFIPYELPPKEPLLHIEGKLADLHAEAMAALSRLTVAAGMVPSTDWFLYGFVRKEAVISSQIEGTQATLEDVLTFEVTHQAERPADVEEVSTMSMRWRMPEVSWRNPKGYRFVPACCAMSISI